jgi:hypothetical protein
VGRSQFPLALLSGQPLSSHRCRHLCACRCLLKGCERWFVSHQGHARYCSPDCQNAARRWQRWHAGQRHRATTNANDTVAISPGVIASGYGNRCLCPNQYPRHLKSSYSLPWSIRSRPYRRHRRLPSPPTARVSAQPKFGNNFWADLVTDRVVTSFSALRRGPLIMNSVHAHIVMFMASSTAASTTQTAAATGLSFSTSSPSPTTPIRLGHVVVH